MKNDVTVIVSSCDAYADCWEPFFKLFEMFWPNCPYSVILITETKHYIGTNEKIQSFPALTSSGKRSMEWGGRLIECLRRLECQTILYLQEDFFLKAPVDQARIAEFSEFMAGMSWVHENTMQIGICPLSNHGPFHLTEHPLLWEVDKQARYRFSLLPGLWNRLDLLHYLKPTYSAWEFEETSHYRARRTPKRILTVNRHLFRFDAVQIYPFDPSGIIRGKWVRNNVVELFSRHGIELDFSRRGFSDEALVSKIPFMKRVCVGLRRRWMLVNDRVNEAIDHYRA